MMVGVEMALFIAFVQIFYCKCLSIFTNDLRAELHFLRNGDSFLHTLKVLYKAARKTEIIDSFILFSIQIVRHQEKHIMDLYALPK